MPVVGEKAAWGILHRYKRDILRIDSGTLLAIYAVGSLPGGYYRPGQSDIDAILIVTNDSESVWGNSGHPSRALAKLNREYEIRFHIPKEFAPFPIQEQELFPPHDPREQLAGC
jgi:hypothetical protein